MPESYLSILEQGIEKRHFPGASTALVRQGKTPVLHHVGYRQTEPTCRLLEADTIYDVASLTKVMATTTVTMALVASGDLSLDTPVQSVLSWFRYPDIRIEHLLTHTSGLPADVPRANTLGDIEAVRDCIFKTVPVAQIARETIYSDIGFIVLGWVLEACTRTPLDRLAHRLVFEPLGMHDTTYRPDVARTAPTEYRDDQVFTGWLHGKVHDEKAFAMNGIAGHAGLFSTASDIANFMQAMLESRFVLKPDKVSNLFAPCTVTDRLGRRPVTRSLGWDRATPGGTAGEHVAFDATLVHTGFTGCNLFIDRFHGVGFVLLSNAVHPHRSRNGIHPYRNAIGTAVMAGQRRNESL